MISYICYTAYFLVLCTIIQNSVQKDNNIFKRLFIVLTFGVMMLMMALRRFDVGNDTSHYLNFYRQIGLGFLDYDSRLEAGFRGLTILISRLSDGNEQVFIATCVILSFVPILILLIKCSKNLFYSIALFWTLSCINIASASRQGIAIGIICIGYLVLRSNIKASSLLYCLICIIASFFHRSAIFLIFVPLLRKRIITIRTLLLLITITTLLTATSFADLIFSRFAENYYNLYFGVKSGWAAAVFNMMLGVIAIIIDYYSITRNDRKKFFLKLEEDLKETNLLSRNEYLDNNFFRWMALLFSACCILSVNNSVIGRMANYFEPFLIIYLSNHIYNIKYRKLFAVGIIFSRVVFSVLALIIRPEWNSFFPFFFFWE